MYLTVLSGQSISAQADLNRGGGGEALGLFVPSLNSTEVRLQFTTTSGGLFTTAYRPDGTGTPFVVYSGAGPGFGIFPFVLTSHVRVTLVASQTDVRTFELVPLFR